LWPTAGRAAVAVAVAEGGTVDREVVDFHPARMDGTGVQVWMAQRVLVAEREPLQYRSIPRHSDI
jgi:hypothetical protein